MLNMDETETKTWENLGPTADCEGRLLILYCVKEVELSSTYTMIIIKMENRM